MLFNPFLLIAILLGAAWGRYDISAEDDAMGNMKKKITKASETSMRFANIDMLPHEHSLVKIYLYQSPNSPGIVVPEDNKSGTIANQLIPSVKNYVMFNGHPSMDSTEPYEALRAALFQEGPANILFAYIDWTQHSLTFTDALALAESLGQQIGDSLLHNQFHNPHFIAHCVGAEVASAVAKYLQNKAQLLIPRMTVFDPYITNKTLLNNAERYVRFVDVYHAGVYEPAFPPVGHVDFYPNGGMKQPGCDQAANVQKSVLCHHRRAIYLYTESVLQQVRAVEVKYDTMEAKLQVLDQPRVVEFGHNVNPAVMGAFYLPTHGQAPYLVEYF